MRLENLSEPHFNESDGLKWLSGPLEDRGYESNTQDVSNMFKRRLVSTIFSCLLLVLVLVNILFAYGNQSLQSEVAERQQMIAQAIQLEGVYRQVITVIAEMAVKTNDPQLKELLKTSGFALGPQPGAGKSSK
jgi:hypothetical protein